MKRVISIFLMIMIIINICTTIVFASGSSSEKKSTEEANLLLKDIENKGNDYYLQFSRSKEPIFVELAESYLDNKPLFYLTNSWSNVLNEEYRRKGTFKNEYIYDLVIMGFLKYENSDDTYNDSLLNREKEFATDLYSELSDEVGSALDEKPISNSTWENFNNTQTINDINLVISIIDYAEESYESYLDIVASKMALLESKRDKVALFRASVDAALNIGDKDYTNAMNIIIDAIDKANPDKYLNKKTGIECSNTLISVVEDVVKEMNPIFGLIDLSVSGIDLLFNSTDNASNDIKLAYLYLTDSYLHNGLRSIANEYITSNEPSKRPSEKAREFINAFKTYLRFQQYGNNYADEWLDNYIQVRSGPIKRLFHKDEIQNAKDMKEQCKDENTRIGNMLKNINKLEKEEDVWKVIRKKKKDKADVGENESEYSPYKKIIDDLESEYGKIALVQSNYYKSAEDAWEVEGVCLLTLLDMDNEGSKELFAVCKKPGDDYYKGFVYTIESGMAKCAFQIDEATLFTNGGFFNIATIHKDGKDCIACCPTKEDGVDTILYGYFDGQYQTYEYKCYLSYTSDTSKNSYYINNEKVDELIYANSKQEHGASDIYTSKNNTILCVRGFYKDSPDYKKLNDKTSKTKTIIQQKNVSDEIPTSATFSELKAKELTKPAIFHCIEKGLNEWTPEIEDTETFWDVLSFYCNFTEWINTVDYSRIGEYGQYKIIPNDLLENAAYAFYKDFDGNLPSIEDNIWRAQTYDEKSTGITIGDTSPIIITSEKYQHNKDGTIDAEYETDFSGTAGAYKVHFEPNSNYNKVSSEEPYYYYVSYVERLDTPATAKDNGSKKLSMEEFRIPYGHYFGGKPHGEGSFGIDIDLYEDSSFSIESAFDPFTGDNGDAYSFAGTFKVDQVNDDGNPVLHFHCDEGDLELVWDGKYLKDDAFYVWYVGE